MLPTAHCPISKKEKKHKKDKKHKKEKQSKRGEGSGATIPDALISEDDYYLKAPELKYWLLTEKQLTFDSLTAKESRSMFRKFVKCWNEGRLDLAFYNGLPSQTLEASASYTAHKWGFAKKLSSRDAAILESTKDSVSVATHVTTKAPALRYSAGSHGGGTRVQIPARADGPSGLKRGRDGEGSGGGGWSASQSLAQSRLQEHQKSEKEKMEELRKTLGVKPGERIQIAPRRD